MHQQYQESSLMRIALLALLVVAGLDLATSKKTDLLMGVLAAIVVVGGLILRELRRHRWQSQQPPASSDVSD